METAEKEILRGGQFLVKETNCEDIFTLEDLNEEQQMMRESTKEFVDRELWAHWERFENKDYAYTEETMRKAGELGLLSVCSRRRVSDISCIFTYNLTAPYLYGLTQSTLSQMLVSMLLKDLSMRSTVKCLSA